MWKKNLLLAVLPLFACHASPPPHPSFDAPAAFKEGLVNVLNKYEVVQNALADSQAVLSNNALSIMHGELHSLQVQGLDSAARNYLDTVHSKIMVVLHDTSLARGASIPAVRRAFRDFTPLFSDLLIAYGVTQELPVYLFTCKEEKGGKAADWLQILETPKSPYLDAAGRPCGKKIRRL
jgi:hypothetical protein